MEPRIIKTKTQYEESLAEVERLVAIDPELETSEAERLELLATLVEKYEKEHFYFELPEPIDFIRFRMEEQGLRQSDLVPYIGSKSKVSEVLSGKRPLTIQMIRALVDGLGIPAKVLLQNSSATQTEADEIEWEKFPVREMWKRGWITASKQEIRNHAADLAQRFVQSLDITLLGPALTRRTYSERSGRDMDRYALFAWIVRVLTRAKEEGLSVEYKKGTVTTDFMKEVAQLSRFDDGPLRAKEFLAGIGIALIIEKHLPKTKLDGAAMLSGDGRPVIGLTIRFDRIDNFWFTLMHELAHVFKHLRNYEEPFFDDLQVVHTNDFKEMEADKFSQNALIPRHLWTRSDAFRQQTPDSIVKFAKELNIHPAIVAGRIRREKNNYYILSQLVGSGQVQTLFTEIDWNNKIIR